MNRWLCVGPVALGLFLLAAVQSAQAGDDKVELKLHLKKGESYGLMETNEVRTSLTIQDQKHDSEQTSGYGHSFTVTDVDAHGVMTVRVRYEVVVYRHEEGTEVTDYDSRKPPKEIPLAARGAAALLGQSYTITIQPNGKVLEVRGIDAALAVVLKKVDLPDGPMKTQVTQSLKTHLSADGVRDRMQQLTTYIPEHPVAVHDQWSKSLTEESELSVKMDETWTLRARGRKTAVLGVQSKVQTTPDKPMILGFAKLACDMSGSGSGALDVDVETGWPLGGSMQFSVKGSVKVTGVPGMKEPLTCPMSLEGEDKIEPLPKK